MSAPHSPTHRRRGHFYGSMKGSRGKVTRCGTKSSGITTHVHGWDIGGGVAMTQNNAGEDVVSLFLTGGTNSIRPPHAVARFVLRRDSNGSPFIVQEEVEL